MPKNTRGKTQRLSATFPPPGVTIKVDSVLKSFAQYYAELLATDEPSLKVGEREAVIWALLALEESGQAVRHVNYDGSITWKATPEFLSSTGLEPGGLVTLEPDAPASFKSRQPRRGRNTSRRSPRKS